MDDRPLPRNSNELPELSALSTEDIPVAVRHASEAPNQSSSTRKPLLLMVGSAVGLLLVLVPLLMAVRSQAPSRSTPTVATETSPSPSPASQAPANSQSAATSPASERSTDAMLGHLPFAEAPANELVPLNEYRQIKLRRSAATKLQEMMQAAAEDGVTLVPLSGFRTEAEQNELFFGVKAERGQQAATRAALSAPPGYSEHHTGYAIDLGDGDRSNTDLEFEFENTKAFKWLQEHAAYYSFEMSFPKNNSMGVSYEPWHWRFVGDRQSLETFYRAKEGADRSSASSAPSTPEQGN